MTKIEWCDRSWNPISGCTPISEGCMHCYAKRMTTRLKGRFGYPADDPFRVTYHPDKLEDPLKWKKPCKIFVCSMGDLFHEDVQREWKEDVYRVIERCPQHTFLILTKRPENVASWWLMGNDNAWLGVTAENQARADERIPFLLQIKAAKRGISVEPMLGPINIEKYLPEPPEEIPFRLDYLDWVICGAETGPGKRYMQPHWALSLMDQCRAANVPFFFKKDSDGDLPFDMPREWPE